MKRNKLLERKRSRIKADIRIFVEHSFNVARRIHSLLEHLDMDQKEFASKLGKSESEISKWLRGTHNFTLKTISRIESVLESPVVLTNQYDMPETAIIQKYTESNILFTMKRDSYQESKQVYTYQGDWIDFNEKFPETASHLRIEC